MPFSANVVPAYRESPWCHFFTSQASVAAGNRMFAGNGQQDAQELLVILGRAGSKTETSLLLGCV